MKSIFIFLLPIVIPIAVFSQNGRSAIPGKDFQLHGVVMEQDSKQLLAYASIGVLNKPAGTVSDSLGHFELAVGNEYLGDTLQVSMVGYYPIKRLVRELMKADEPLIINLTKKVIQLNEVVVSNQFQHTVIVGRQSSGSFIQASIIPKGDKSPTIGAESGLKIQAKHYPALLDNFNFYLSANNLKYIKFRANIYSLRNNLPDTLLFNKEILVSLNNYKTGWTKIDLTSYHIVINSDCAVTLQWVDYNKDMVKSPEVLIPAAVSFSHICYFRTASQDKWKTVKGNFSFYATLQD
ncbi:MAG: carboxypeptidase-like regulatory domain-containing protein [Mucilaginibacter sp.]